MKKYVLAAACVLILAGSVGWMRWAGTPEDAVSGSEPRRPSPIEEHLPRPPVLLAGESVRTRVADTVHAAEKPGKELQGTDWAVVVAIYKEYQAAERRARSISEATDFKADVFPPDGQGSKYMVVLESGLTNGKAMQIRDRAISAGLPPDTYVTRLAGRQEQARP